MSRSAAALGAVSGLRTFGAWSGLVLRGRITDRRLRAGLLTAAAGEMAADKTPWIPPRYDAPALVGRVVSGGLAGRMVDGARGARVGAAVAGATTYASERARALIGERLGVPDVAVAAVEDVLVVAVATVAAGETEPDEAPGGASDPSIAATPSAPPVPVTLVRGLAAGAIGTAAMTSAQMAVLRLTGGEPSSAPGDIGRKLVDVPRSWRGAFNQAMHFLYGTSWGAPFGLLQRSRRASGLVFGAAVWAVSLVELPLLGVAPPPWRQSPAALARDLGFHLVYGTATAAVLQA